MLENWSDIETKEESNDEYESSSNDEVENEVLEVDDQHGSSKFSESEELSIVSDLMEATARGRERRGIRRGGVEGGRRRSRGRGMGVRGTSDRGIRVREKVKRKMELITNTSG